LALCVALILAYVGLGLAVLPPGPSGGSLTGAVALGLVWLVGAVLLERLQRRPWRQCLAVVTPARAAWVLGAAIGVHLFFRAFMSWKAQLPFWRPFTWDTWLADLDWWLHGGDPARFIPSPWLPALDAIYYAWFPVLALVVLWMAWWGDWRFFLAFAFTWIVLGTGVALAAPSAGPIFYQGVTGDARFGAPLTGLTTRVVADALWSAYSEGRPTSISAFPSLHVAIPALYVAAMWRTRLRWPAVLFWALTLLGSIGLLWHYAVDSYAGTLGALGCWWVTGKLTTAPSR
jgi:hypothetical protein